MIDSKDQVYEYTPMKTPFQTTGEKQLVIYGADDGRTQIDVRLDEDTIWLTAGRICEMDFCSLNMMISICPPPHS